MGEKDRSVLQRRIELLERRYADAVGSRDGYKAKLQEARARLARAERHAPHHRRLRRQWIVPVTQPMVLISQVQRSGGTLLNRLFDGHPECFAHPMELKWGRPRKWHWPSFDPVGTGGDAAFELLEEMWIRKAVTRGGYAKYSAWSDRHRSADRRLYPFVFDRELHREVFADGYPRGSSPAPRRAALNAYLTGLFNAWLDYQNLYATPKRWVTSFIPWLIAERESVERFFADYPDGVLITIVRDPISWFASASRHRVAAEPLDALRRWTTSTEASMEAAGRHGERVIVVLFEDLVTRTGATMRAICARLGIAFGPVVLQPTYNSMAVLSNSSFKPTTEIDAATAARQPDAAPPELGTAGAAARELYREVSSRCALRV